MHALLDRMHAQRELRLFLLEKQAQLATAKAACLRSAKAAEELQIHEHSRTVRFLE